MRDNATGAAIDNHSLRKAPALLSHRRQTQTRGGLASEGSRRSHKLELEKQRLEDTTRKRQETIRTQHETG
eukprot:1189164-Prorocentrum_minimum.AAC.5